MRLHQVAYGTQAHKDTGRAVGARSLSDIAGFAPATLHALGVRVSAEVIRRQHDIVITNVPGPQVPLYAAGARMVASYPVLPLAAGHLLTIGVTSYDGEVFFGLNADRDAISDLDVLAQCLTDALEELLDTTVRAAAPAADPQGLGVGPPCRRPRRRLPARRRPRSVRPRNALRSAHWPPVPPAAAKTPAKKAAVRERLRRPTWRPTTPASPRPRQEAAPGRRQPGRRPPRRKRDRQEGVARSSRRGSGHRRRGSGADR